MFLFTKTQMFISALFACIFGMIGMAMATPSVEDLWTAFDVSGINTKVLAILTTFVTINLAFVAYKYIKRAGNRG